MVSRDHQTLDEHYRTISEAIKTEDALDFGPLVVPTGNATSPVHRWFHLKEAYSCRFFERVLRETDLGHERRRLRVLDPFCGSGTTAVSLVEHVGTLPAMEGW